MLKLLVLMYILSIVYDMHDMYFKIIQNVLYECIHLVLKHEEIYIYIIQLYYWKFYTYRHP